MTLNEVKQSVLNASLDKGKVKIYINTRVEGVVLPSHLMASQGTALNLSRHFPGPMNLGDFGICAVLSFQGRSFTVEVPWEAIMAVEDTDSFHDFSTAQAFGLAQAVTEPRPQKQPFKPEVIVDNTEKLGLSEIQLTPPRTGHLRLLH